MHNSEVFYGSTTPIENTILDTLSWGLKLAIKDGRQKSSNLHDSKRSIS